MRSARIVGHVESGLAVGLDGQMERERLFSNVAGSIKMEKDCMVVIVGIVGNVKGRKVEQAAAAQTVCEATRVEGRSGGNVEFLDGAVEVVALDDLGVVGSDSRQEDEKRREQEKHAGHGPRWSGVDEDIWSDRRAARMGAGIIGGSRTGMTIDRGHWVASDMADATMKGIRR